MDFYMTMNVLTETQYQKWLELYREFMMKFMQVIIETQASEPDAEKTRLSLTSMLPLKRIFGKLGGK
jgi:hypothetical protein